MSKKDPDPKSVKTYLIRKKHGYIVAREGEDEHHIDDEETIEKIEALIEKRGAAGLELSKLLKERFPLTAMSHHFATHTTGAGDYDPTTQKK